MATSKSTYTPEDLQLSPDEIAAIKSIREKRAAGEPAAVTTNDMALLIEAIRAGQPKPKVHAYQRKKVCRGCKHEHKHNTPLKRVWYQHGAFELTKEAFCNDTIELLNKVRPGHYCNGLVRVNKRKDRAYDITWPAATVAQRMRVINEAGATFNAILQRCIDEAADPKRFKGPDDGDDD